MGQQVDKELADQFGAIAADPAWLPYRVRDEGRMLKLLHLPRADLGRLSFIDNRVQIPRWKSITESARRAEFPVAEIAERAPIAGSDCCHFIFHSAFCCSTLMSRALDIEGTSCVLREPQSLTDLGAMKPRSGLSDDQELALKVVLDLMQRPRLPGEKTVIKPANLVNPLIEHMLNIRPYSRALVMYASLPDFVMAIARGKRWSWPRQLAAFYRDHLEFETPQTRELVLLTDLQIAAFVWLQHQAQFARLVRDLPATRLATLRADVFLAQPAKTIAAAAALFDLGLTESDATAIAAGPLFQSHSKRPDESFDQSTRKRDEMMVKLAYGTEMEQALKWAEDVAAQASVPMDLGAALIN
jgi:hypothetical protein